MKYLSLILFVFLASCTKGVQVTQVISLQDRVSYVANESPGDTLPHLYNEQLEKAGILKNGHFVDSGLKNIDFTNMPKNIMLKGKRLKTLRFEIKEIRKESGANIKIFSGESNDTITVGLGPYMPAFGLADVIPGGYDEFIIYDEGYIINGTNYNLEVYEVK